MDFYEWLRENTNYIDDYDTIKEIHSMFILDEMDISEFIKGINNKSVFREPLRKFLDDYNFIFVD
jgi:hypothetical protein